MLAGVAAGALALGFLSVAGASSASAAPKAKPKAAITNSVSAVRAGTLGTIPAAKLAFAKTSAKPTQLVIITAPSSAARMYLNNTAGGYPTVSDDSATLNASDGTLATVGTVSGDDSTYGIAVDTAGSYTAALGNGTDTATFTFTTTGAPSSMTLTPASQTVLVGAVASLAVTIKDSNGNNTQAALGDTIAISASGDDTPSPTSITAAQAYLGTYPVTVTTQNSGTETITATPQGTLPSTGVTAATATVTASGSVSATAITNAVVTSPLTVINNPVATTASIARTSQVPQGSSSIGIRIDDTTGNAAGTQIRLGFVLNSAAIAAGASINGEAVTSTDDTVFVNVTTDSAKSASTTVTLGGGAVNAGSVLTMNQYNVSNALVGSVSLTVSELAPAVYGDDVTFDPAGPLVAQLGTSVPVTVTVDDSFGTPQSGWTVQAWRSATLLSSGTTNALGEASVSVTNATGAVTGTLESYTFKAVPPIGSTVTASGTLSVTWTTTGGITSLSVAVNPGSTPISDPAGAAPTTGALLTVPYDGTADTLSTATFNLTTGAAGGTANGGEVARLVPTSTPANDVTVTVPLGSEGIFVTDTASTAWAGGKKSLTVGSDDTVYVFGTKVGEHTITLTSGGKTVAVKVKVQTSANAAYNMDLTPATQTVGAGSINTVTLTVTDVFGNPVQTTDDTGKVTVNATGEILLAGYQTTGNFNTNASGTATITVIAGNSAGTGVLAAGPATSNTAAAWKTGYTKPTGAPDPKTSAAAEIIVSGAPGTQSIAIVGARGTSDVSLPSDETCRSYAEGPPPRALPVGCITVDGVTTGFDEGSAMTPEYRFPGQTSYTAGIDVTTNADGEFNWYRKTGKKIYVRFMSGDVVSSRVIIPAK